MRSNFQRTSLMVLSLIVCAFVQTPESHAFGKGKRLAAEDQDKAIKVERKTGEAAELETASWLNAIKTLAQDGDWLVVRGYHSTDDLVAFGTNSAFSHAVVLDLTQNEIIEAVQPAVRIQTLPEFLANANRVRLVRPAGASTEGGIERGREAVESARSVVGQSYDLFGAIGIPSDKRFYCSELAVWSWGIKVDKFGALNVVAPKDIHKYGNILFDSKDRDGVAEQLPAAQ